MPHYAILHNLLNLAVCPRALLSVASRKIIATISNSLVNIQSNFSCLPKGDQIRLRTKFRNNYRANNNIFLSYSAGIDQVLDSNAGYHNLPANKPAASRCIGKFKGWLAAISDSSRIISDPSFSYRGMRKKAVHASFVATLSTIGTSRCCFTRSNSKRQIADFFAIFEFADASIAWLATCNYTRPIFLASCSARKN